MAFTQMHDLTSSRQSLFDQRMKANVGYSQFVYSRKTTFNADNGMIIPFDYWETLPGDNFEIKIRYAIETLPLQVAPYTNYHVRFHFYAINNRACWSGWDTFITKGRSGNINKTVPCVRPASDTVDWSLAEGKHINFSSPLGLPSFLGSSPFWYAGASSNSNYLPYTVVTGVENTDYFKTGYAASPVVSALPFMMYQKIFRFNYLPNNLMQDNKVWFPDDLHNEWRLNYNASNLFAFTENGSSAASWLHLFVPEGMSVPSLSVSSAGLNIVPKATGVHADEAVDLLSLRYAQYENDIFTTALPWLTRGTAPSVQSDAGINMTLPVDFTLLTNNSLSAGSGWSGFLGVGTGDSVPSPGSVSDTLTLRAANSVSNGPRVVNTLAANVTASNVPVTLSLTAQRFRELFALSAWQERNALTNGNYNAYIKAHFDKFPDMEDYEPHYIGGYSDLITFQQVLQTTPTSTSPLGTQAGLGTSRNEGYIGSYYSKDYGAIMGIMIITPEVSYVQGLPHYFTDVTPEDFFSPEFENLSFQPILNKQLYVSGTSTVDNDLFGYSNRYIYLKCREDVVRGLFALPADVAGGSDLLFSAYAQARIFKSTPKLSNEFVTASPNNLRRDYMMYPGQPVYKCQVITDLGKCVRPMSYQSYPATFGF